MRISDEIRVKSKKLLESGKVKEEFETNKRIHFRVQGETEEHSVIFDKEGNKFLCDCTYFTLKGKYCSHIEAVKLLLKRKRKKIEI